MMVYPRVLPGLLLLLFVGVYPAAVYAQQPPPATEAGMENEPDLTTLSRDERVTVYIRWLGDTRKSLAVRKDAATQLGGMYHDKRAIPALQKALKDPSPELRLCALKTLGGYFEPGTTDSLVAAAGDEDVAVRAMAATLLGNRRQTVTLPTIIQLTKDADAGIRTAAFTSLRYFDDPLAVDALLPLLQSPDAALRGVAVSSLVENSDLRVAGALVGMMKDTDITIRRSVASALLKRIQGYNSTDEMMPAMITALKDEDAQVQSTAIQALGSLPYAEAIPPLLELQKTAQGETAKAVLLALLKHQTNIKVISIARQAAGNQNVEIRQTALYCVLRAKDSVDIPILRKMVNDPEQNIRQIALRALLQFYPEDANDLIETANKEFLPNSDSKNVLPTLTFGVMQTLPRDTDKLIAILNDPTSDEKTRNASANLLAEIREPRGCDAVCAATKAGKITSYAPWLCGRQGAECIYAMATAADAKTRAFAAGLLHYGRNAKAADLLIKLMQDPDPMVYGAVVDLSGLGNYRPYNNGTVPALISFYRREQDAQLRGQILRSFWYIRDDRAIDFLLQLLKENPSRSTSSDISQALSMIGTPRAVEPLQRLPGRTDEYSQYLSRQSIWKTKGAAAEDEIIAVLDDPGTKEPLRSFAVEALLKIGSQRAIKVITRMIGEEKGGSLPNLQQLLYRVHEPRIIPALIPLLNSHEPYTRSPVLQILSAYDDPRPVPVLLADLQHFDPRVRDYTLDTLGKKRATEAVEPLRRLLAKTRNVLTRQRIIQALGKIGDARIVPDLRPLLNDEDSQIRDAAALALFQCGEIGTAPALIARFAYIRNTPDLFGTTISFEQFPPLSQAFTHFGERVLPSLADALNNRNSNVRECAVLTLSEIHSPRSTDLLIRLLKQEKNQQIRRVTIESLGELQDQRAVDTLLAIVKTPEDSNRYAAFMALGNIGDPASIPTMKALLYDDEPGFPDYAVDVLGKIGDPAVVDDLLAAVPQYDTSFKFSVLTALGNLKSPKAIQFLLDSLSDHNVNIREYALTALKKVTGQDFGTDAEQWRQWWKGQPK